MPERDLDLTYREHVGRVKIPVPKLLWIYSDKMEKVWDRFLSATARGARWALYMIQDRGPNSIWTTPYPLGNVYNGGDICWGRNEIPTDTRDADRRFFASPFDFDLVDDWVRFDGSGNKPGPVAVPRGVGTALDKAAGTDFFSDVIRPLICKCLDDKNLKFYAHVMEQYRRGNRQSLEDILFHDDNLSKLLRKVEKGTGPVRQFFWVLHRIVSHIKAYLDTVAMQLTDHYDENITTFEESLDDFAEGFSDVIGSIEEVAFALAKSVPLWAARRRGWVADSEVDKNFAKVLPLLIKELDEEFSWVKTLMTFIPMEEVKETEVRSVFTRFEIMDNVRWRHEISAGLKNGGNYLPITPDYTSLALIESRSARGLTSSFGVPADLVKEQLSRLKKFVVIPGAYDQSRNTHIYEIGRKQFVCSSDGNSISSLT